MQGQDEPNDSASGSAAPDRTRLPPHAIPSAIPYAIVVMGVSGSGKSTLGTALAAALGCRFFEGDTFHDAASIAKMRAGTALTDADRWPWLDRLGAAVHAALATDRTAVVACSALKRDYRDRLAIAIREPARFVLLQTDRDELARRVGNRPGHYMPGTLLDSQIATLERPTPGEPALTLDARLPVADLCRRVIDWVTT